MKHIVFVDFDGVLTSNRVHIAQQSERLMWNKFDPVVIDFFNMLHNTYEDVSFVWTTTWRNNIPNGDPMIDHYAYCMWSNAGFQGNFGRPWTVNQENDPTLFGKRALEILYYLETYGQNTNDYLVLDDSDYDFNRILGKKRFVKTDPDDGMLFRHMRRAIQLIENEWIKR